MTSLSGFGIKCPDVGWQVQVFPTSGTDSVYLVTPMGSGTLTVPRPPDGSNIRYGLLGPGGSGAGLSGGGAGERNGTSSSTYPAFPDVWQVILPEATLSGTAQASDSILRINDENGTVVRTSAAGENAFGQTAGAEGGSGGNAGGGDDNSVVGAGGGGGRFNAIGGAASAGGAGAGGLGQTITLSPSFPSASITVATGGDGGSVVSETFLNSVAAPGDGGQGGTGDAQSGQQGGPGWFYMYYTGSSAPASLSALPPLQGAGRYGRAAVGTKFCINGTYEEGDIFITATSLELNSVAFAHRAPQKAFALIYFLHFNAATPGMVTPADIREARRLRVSEQQLSRALKLLGDDDRAALRTAGIVLQPISKARLFSSA